MADWTKEQPNLLEVLSHDLEVGDGDITSAVNTVSKYRRNSNVYSVAHEVLLLHGKKQT